MAITVQEFEELGSRLEREAKRSPRSYKLRLGAFALLGYLYIGAVLLGLVVVTAAIVAVVIAGKGALLSSRSRCSCWSASC